MDNKTTKDQLQAVWFAAGVAVVIACLERAAVLSIFKQWHMWVFLALNLLLIAILFTSTHPPPDPSNPPPKSCSGEETEGKTTETRLPEAAEPNSQEDVGENGVNGLKMSRSEEREDVRFEEEEEDSEITVDLFNSSGREFLEDDGGDDESSAAVLSNEELNEKVEAFISRFRQEYLVSDVKISRSRSDNVCGSGVFSKTITV